jgi:tryptophan synthase alpha chain
MSVERIDACFRELKARKQTALVAYVMVGDPNVEESYACARAALDAGADVLELAVAFSDPTADGPVISAAGYRAIHQGGSLRATLTVAEKLRAGSEAPLVLFSYYNPVLTFGAAALPTAAARSGIDGLLLVDLPPEEGEDLRAAAARERLAMIRLVAPTTDLAREKRVLADASGFVYYVSVTGVTGSSQAPLADAGQRAAALRERARLPVVVGFGIRTADQARTVAASGVDGVVVGTEIVRVIAAATNPEARVRAVSELVGSLRRGLDQK